VIGADRALEAWSWDEVPIVQPMGTGLINQTFVVEGSAAPQAVLQRLNTAIFVPEVNEDIEAVTRHVERKGLPTPLLRRTHDGRLWHQAQDGSVWRVLSWVDGRTIDRIWSTAEAAEAGELVARFHAATADLEWTFRSVRGAFHDTDLRMQQLSTALDARRSHRLYERVAPVAESIQHAWRSWDGPRDLPERIVHGDLKISNVRFQGERALALVDLDTLGYGTLDAELGDAFRSWCNPAREDDPARFDAELFAAGIRGYAAAAVDVTDLEWEAIVPGVERITLELAARFAADALEENYFGFDTTRFATRGDHNLARAQGQLQLVREVSAARRAAEELVRAVRPGRASR
jgi:Ser/Thr protein kinase RdoA (MazF antagonist)